MTILLTYAKYLSLFEVTFPQHVAPRAAFHNRAKLVVEDILEHGGEGVILQKAKSYYEHGRSSSLIKIKACNSYSQITLLTTIKSAQGDQEGIVLSISAKTVLVQLYVLLYIRPLINI